MPLGPTTLILSRHPCPFVQFMLSGVGKTASVDLKYHKSLADVIT